MRTDLNQPHSKTQSIIFSIIRFLFILWCGCRVILTDWKATCPYTQHDHIIILHYAAVIVMIFSAVILFIFLCGFRFNRVLFFIFYTIVTLCTIYLFGSSIVSLRRQSLCPKIGALSHLSLLITLNIHLTVWLIILVPLDIGLRCLNIGGSLVWPAFMFFTEHLVGGVCQEYGMSRWIGWQHLVIIIVCWFLFLIVRLSYKSYLTSRIWRAAVLISIIAMVICYVYSWVQAVLHHPTVFMDRYHQNKCQHRIFMIETYRRYGWWEIIPPVLLLVFTTLENGDVIRRNQLQRVWDYPEPFHVASV